MKKILHQPAPQRFRVTYDFARPFERHLGRRLSHSERLLINALERHRLRNRRIRFQIVDPPDPADGDS
ncbi:MAG: hypothetical protein K2M80_01645, partial [Muribaculaceae bacterium]|nr:hypothetical protein [Muribaculaceae bacterium]